MLLLEDLQLSFLEFDLYRFVMDQGIFEEEEDVAEALCDVLVWLALGSVFVLVEVYEVEGEEGGVFSVVGQE